MNPGIARYFQDIFVYDWDERARQKLGYEHAMPIVENAVAGDLASHRQVAGTAIYED